MLYFRDARERNNFHKMAIGCADFIIKDVAILLRWPDIGRLTVAESSVAAYIMSSKRRRLKIIRY